MVAFPASHSTRTIRTVVARLVGVVTPLNQLQTFEVYALGGPQLRHPPEALAFQLRPSADPQRGTDLPAREDSLRGCRRR